MPSEKTSSLNAVQLEALRSKARWVWEETLRIHRSAPETRLASSLSDVELFTAIYYGGFFRFDPKRPRWEGRDRLIVSKGHGGVSLYPILADLGFFDRAELGKVCQDGSFLGGIPDDVPGFETVNGSLGHGLGVGCGMALALRSKGSDSRVFVVCGDGELNSGAVWEAVMFAPFQKLGRLVLVVDDNRISMLGYQKDILNSSPYEKKLAAFGWKVESVDGHDLAATHRALKEAYDDDAPAPKAVIAHTVKGKGVPQFEGDPICHVKSLKPEEVDCLLAGRGA